MWFAYGFPVAWLVLLYCAACCLAIAYWYDNRRAAELGVWLLFCDAVVVLIDFVTMTALLMEYSEASGRIMESRFA